MGLQFDATINLGHVLMAVGFLGGGYAFVLAMKSEIKMLAKDILLQNVKIDNQGVEITKLGQILINQAVSNERMNNLDKQIDDLRHGRGFVVNREYGTIVDRN